MFSEPQVLTVSGSAKSLNRLNSTADGSEFATADRAFRMSVKHSYGRRVRHTAAFVVDTLDPNPLISGQFVKSSATYRLSVDLPPGYDTATAKAAVDAFLANLSATSGANVTKLVNGES